MKKRLCFLTALLALLVLSACGGETAGPTKTNEPAEGAAADKTDGTWTSVDVTAFSVAEAAGVDETPFTPDGFDPAKIDDPAHSYTPCGWLDENTVLCSRVDAEAPDTLELAAVTLDGAVTALDVVLDSTSLVAARDGVVLYAKTHDTALPDGITLARWDGTETLTPIYAFSDGSALTFQQFFSPDGSKALLSWCRDDADGAWKVRVIDLKTGDFLDLTPPETEGDAPAALLSRWLDDQTILVTAPSDLADGSDAVAWEYTLPN